MALIMDLHFHSGVGLPVTTIMMVVKVTMITMTMMLTVMIPVCGFTHCSIVSISRSTSARFQYLEFIMGPPVEGEVAHNLNGSRVTQTIPVLCSPPLFILLLTNK